LFLKHESRRTTTLEEEVDKGKWTKMAIKEVDMNKCYVHL
jgi:hypothetical protein